MGGQGRTERIVASRERRRSPVGRLPLVARRPASRRRPRSSRLRAPSPPSTVLPSGRTLRGSRPGAASSRPAVGPHATESHGQALHLGLRNAEEPQGRTGNTVRQLEDLPRPPVAIGFLAAAGGSSYANASAPPMPDHRREERGRGSGAGRRATSGSRPTGGALRAPAPQRRAAEGRRSAPARSAVRPRDSGTKRGALRVPAPQRRAPGSRAPERGGRSVRPARPEDSVGADVPFCRLPQVHDVHMLRPSRRLRWWKSGSFETMASRAT